MHYQQCTALEGSNVWCNHTQETPFLGTGQGNCEASHIWLLISSILMDCLSELGEVMTMQDVAPETIDQWIDGFIDDISLFTSLDHSQSDPNDIYHVH
jgi:hypothetical protein